MPDVRQLQFDVAKAQLENGEGKFKVKREWVDNSADRGVVINSTPLAGEQVDVGSTVTLFVSKGQVTVPNVVGQNIDDATKTLGGPRPQGRRPRTTQRPRHRTAP